MRWSFEPTRLRNNPHFKRRQRIVDRVSLSAGVIATAFAFALAALAGDFAWKIVLYVVFPLLVIAALAGGIAWFIRVRVIGHLNADTPIPLAARHLIRQTWMLRLGFLGAAMTILLLMVGAFLAGFQVQILFWAAMFVIFASGFMTSMTAAALNVLLVREGRQSARKASI